MIATPNEAMIATTAVGKRVPRVPVAALCLALACALGAALVPIAGARADGSVLEYDENGRPDGVRNVDPTGRAGPGSGAAPRNGMPGSSPDTPGNAPGASERPVGPWPQLPEGWFKKGEVVVANPPDNFRTAIESLGFRIIEKVSFTALSFEVWRLAVPPGLTVREALKKLHRRFPSLAIAPNHLYQLSAARDAPRSKARALIGWGPSPPGCGNGIRIGMVDAALDLDHAALRGQNIEYRSFLIPRRKPGPANHGTAVAAMLVGKPTKDGWGGLLPGAALFAGNIFTVTEDGRHMADVIAFLKAIEWLLTKNVHAINLSLAGPDSRIMQYALKKVREKGVAVVSAAGNWASATRPAYPAAYDEVLAITAVDINGIIYPFANRGPYIDFAAPGVGVWTAVPGGGKYQSGTSFAVPYVTTLIASEVRAGTTRSPGELRNLFRRYAVDLGAAGRDDVFGWGSVRLVPRCQ